MTPDAFRRAALALAGAVEGAHHGHPDFRVGGKVFASLGPPGANHGMVKLPPAAQADFVREGGFEPFAGAWGARGCTRVELGVVDPRAVAAALRLAHADAAPKAPVARASRGGKTAKEAPSAARPSSTGAAPPGGRARQTRSRKAK